MELVAFTEEVVAALRAKGYRYVVQSIPSQDEFREESEDILIKFTPTKTLEQAEELQKSDEKSFHLTLDEVNLNINEPGSDLPFVRFFIHKEYVLAS